MLSFMKNFYTILKRFKKSGKYTLLFCEKYLWSNCSTCIELLSYEILIIHIDYCISNEKRYSELDSFRSVRKLTKRVSM